MHRKIIIKTFKITLGIIGFLFFVIIRKKGDIYANRF